MEQRPTEPARCARGPKRSRRRLAVLALALFPVLIVGAGITTSVITRFRALMSESATVPGGAPSATQGKIWIRSDTPNVMIYTDGAGTDFTLGAGGAPVTLDGAYDTGGAGAGRTITLDAGAVELEVTQTSGTAFDINYPAATTLLSATTGIDLQLLTNVTPGGQTVRGINMVIPPSSGGNTRAIDIDTRQTAGTVIDVSFNGATTLTSTVVGLNMDVGTNITLSGNTVTGIDVNVPAGEAGILLRDDVQSRLGTIGDTRFMWATTTETNDCWKIGTAIAGDATGSGRILITGSGNMGNDSALPSVDHPVLSIHEGLSTNWLARMDLSCSTTTGAATIEGFQNIFTLAAPAGATNMLRLDVGGATQFGVGDAEIRCAQPLTMATGDVIAGSEAVGGDLLLQSTTNPTRGNIFFGSAATTTYDEVNDRIGIGTATPAVALEIASTGTSMRQTRYSATASQGAGISIRRSKNATVGTDTVLVDGDRIGTLNFQGYDSAAYQAAAQIRVEVDAAPGANDMPGRMIFLTTPDGSATPGERMRLITAGIQIPDGGLIVAANGGGTLDLRNGGVGAAVALSGDTVNFTMGWLYSDGNVANVGFGLASDANQNASDILLFANAIDISTETTGGVDAVRIGILNENITIGDTDVGTITLDTTVVLSTNTDIRTVAWTTFASTIVGWTSNTSTLVNYKKVGNLVYVQFYIDGVSNTTTVTFTLPFTQINTNGVELKVAIQVGDNNTQLTTAGLLVLGINSATANCFSNMAGAVWTASNNKRVQGQFWYEAQ